MTPIAALPTFAALLRAFVLAFWALIHPGLECSGSAGAIADAAVASVLADAGRAPVYGSHLEDLAALAYFAYRESSLRADLPGDCNPETGACAAHGPWQLHGACGLRSLPEQARCWLTMLHEGAARCPEHPQAIMWGQCSGAVPAPTKGNPKRTDDVVWLASKREERIRILLGHAIQFDETNQAR